MREARAEFLFLDLGGIWRWGFGTTGIMTSARDVEAQSDAQGNRYGMERGI